VRAVLQRVARARVAVEGVEVGAIGPGLLALVGVAADDGPADVAYVAAKIRDLRIFEDDQGRMNRSLGETGGSVLAVSQFTVYGDVRKGRRPSFDQAAPAETGRVLFDALIAEIRASGVPVETGTYRADMQVELVNDGPVTILIDSRRTF
jgi:D-tyrosyl-tRNA(Tyr) deacylase